MTFDEWINSLSDEQRTRLAFSIAEFTTTTMRWFQDADAIIVDEDRIELLNNMLSRIFGWFAFEVATGRRVPSSEIP